MRTFNTGATRDEDDTKPDYEGYLSPLVIEAFGQYMTRHRVQADGKLRASDNWQKGIPRDAYMKSLWRHFMSVWKLHRYNDAAVTMAEMEEALCALMFNAMGYLHEHLKAECYNVPAVSIPTHPATDSPGLRAMTSVAMKYGVSAVSVLPAYPSTDSPEGGPAHPAPASAGARCRCAACGIHGVDHTEYVAMLPRQS